MVLIFKGNNNKSGLGLVHNENEFSNPTKQPNDNTNCLFCSHYKMKGHWNLLFVYLDYQKVHVPIVTMNVINSRIALLHAKLAVNLLSRFNLTGNNWTSKSIGSSKCST